MAILVYNHFFAKFKLTTFWSFYERVKILNQFLAGSTQKHMMVKKQPQNLEKDASAGKVFEMRFRCQKVPGITTTVAILIFTMADRGAIQTNIVLPGKNVVLTIVLIVMFQKLLKMLTRKKLLMKISNAELSSAIRA